MKWPWTRREPTNSELQGRVEALERTVKALQVDWDKTYEKFASLNSRMAQRWRRLVDAERQTGAGDDPGDQPAPGGAGAGDLGITNPLALELLRKRG